MADLCTKARLRQTLGIGRRIQTRLGAPVTVAVVAVWPALAGPAKAQSSSIIAQAAATTQSKPGVLQAQVPSAEAPSKPGAQLHDRLFIALKAATSEAEGRAIENEIWRFWLAEAPDSETRALIEDAMTKRGVYDTEGAEALLDEAIAKSPNYAEAYNQRAFVRFLRENMDGALEDADRALALEPKHFGAMAGRSLILMRQGRFRLAQDQLRQAVAIHPFLKERSMIVPTKGAKPSPERTQPKGIDL